MRQLSKRHATAPPLLRRAECTSLLLGPPPNPSLCHDPHCLYQVKSAQPKRPQQYPPSPPSLKFPNDIIPPLTPKPVFAPSPTQNLRKESGKKKKKRPVSFAPSIPLPITRVMHSRLLCLGQEERRREEKDNKFTSVLQPIYPTTDGIATT